MTELQRLGTEQLESVQQLDALCFVGEPFAAGWWQKAAAMKGACGWVLFREKQPVAYCLFSTVLDEAELLRIAVDPQQRGQGLASRLLRAAQETLVQRGASHLFLEVRASNRVAQSLYQRCGWHSSGRRKNYYPLGDGHEDALLFSWQASSGSELK